MEGHCHKDHNGLLFGDRNEMVKYLCVKFTNQQSVRYGVLCCSEFLLIQRIKLIGLRHKFDLIQMNWNTNPSFALLFGKT